MIRGYFSTIGTIRRPFLYCDFEPLGGSDVGTVGIEFLVDTGADRTLLSPVDAENIGLDVSKLKVGRRSIGVGGEMSPRVLESRLTTQGYSTLLTLHIPEARLPIPSLLGRDFIANFGLFIEERTGRVLFSTRKRSMVWRFQPEYDSPGSAIEVVTRDEEPGRNVAWA